MKKNTCSDCKFYYENLTEKEKLKTFGNDCDKIIDKIKLSDNSTNITILPSFGCNMFEEKMVNMALRNQPYFPLYVQDYLTDEKLALCEWATQGFYIKLLCVLHKQEIYGAILFKQNSKQNLSIEENFAEVLIKLLPIQKSDVIVFLTDLLNNSVIKIDDNMLFQPRMFKDGQLSETRSIIAKKGGGNPSLKSKKKNSVNNKNINPSEKKEKTWRDDFEIYKAEAEKNYLALTADKEFLHEQSELNPGVDIPLTLKKAFVNFWGTPAGWQNKKKTKTVNIEWLATYRNAIRPANKVYAAKNTGDGDTKPMQCSAYLHPTTEKEEELKRKFPELFI